MIYHLRHPDYNQHHHHIGTGPECIDQTLDTKTHGIYHGTCSARTRRSYHYSRLFHRIGIEAVYMFHRHTGKSRSDMYRMLLTPAYN